MACGRVDGQAAQETGPLLPSPVAPASAVTIRTPSPTRASNPTATATPSPPPTPAPSTTPAPSASETPAPLPSATAQPTAVVAPNLETFWTAAAASVERAGRLRIRVIGPSPGELRYEPERSATVIDGSVVFVCTGGAAYDGQSGFAVVPGEWTCGAQALVAGFRRTGQPLDAWGPGLPDDSEIRESVALAEDGTWRWDYAAVNPFAGGDVRTTVSIDPATGEIRSASRRDPVGSTTYGISYQERFPPIALP